MHSKNIVSFLSNDLVEHETFDAFRQCTQHSNDVDHQALYAALCTFLQYLLYTFYHNFRKMYYFKTLMTTKLCW